MSIALRLAQQADLDTALAYVRQYHLEEGIAQSDAETQNALRPLLQHASLGRLWLICLDQQPIGYIAVCFGYSIEFGGRDGFVDEMFILPEYRAKGYGKTALTMTQREAAALGVRALHLEVARDNDRGRRLYHRCGFLPRERYSLMSWTSGNAAPTSNRQTTGDTLPPLENTAAAVTEVLAIDHVYITVSDIPRAEAFYDIVLSMLGFRKHRFELAGEPHTNYYNRHFSYVLRPARLAIGHNPYAPGLHHLCLRVLNDSMVRNIAQQLTAANILVSEPRLYPEYAPDYFAIFLCDPDGLRLEITNYRAERQHRHDHWDTTRP
jgi:ribosomal protein S18 acetylase RimI-like enzyme/catechol 2,3-dioxygenase-like lactoylglutathione lyase family enzyme